MERITEDLRALAAIFESATSEDRAEQLASRAMARARDPQAQARRAVGVLAGIALVAFGFLGVGALADSSVPGQFLYPVDRAFESVTGLVGVNTGGSEERLTEAIALLDRGDNVRAAELIDEAIEAVSKETGLDGQLTGLVSRPVVSTTTTVSETGPIVLPADTEGEPVVIAVAPPAEEPALTLRLATEALLRTVQEAKASGGSEEAAGKLVAAATDAKVAAIQVIVLSAAEPADDTTSTTSTSTTTTSAPGKKSTTTTPTLSGDGSTTTTTTTSVPADGSTTTTTVPGDGSTTTTSTTEPGPIILPPQG